MAHALLIEGLHKRYEEHVAVNNLSLAVPQGGIYGILGPNGAGKSTTLRVALNILARDAGSIALLGIDPSRDRRVLARVGYLPEERGLYKKMRVRDAIVFFARLKGLTRSRAIQQADHWLERMGLSDWRTAKVENLSKGMQQKVQFITAVLHEPELLILDEPTAGLDPVNQEVMRESIQAARGAGRTVIFCTHNMDQAEELCESVCIIARGEKVLDGRLSELKRQHSTDRYVVQFEHAGEALWQQLRALPHLFNDVQRHATAFEFALTTGATLAEVLAALSRLEAPLCKFERLQASLHQIFLRHVADRVQPLRQDPAPARTAHV
jgi:ABC-2 type transport system ATP-binding protein